MKKDLDWVIQEIHATRKVLADSESSGNETADEFTFNNGKEEGLVIALKLLDQLDEPEVLSQEWIDEHRESTFDLDLDEDFETVFIKVEDLQNLLMPKQELPVIPKFVADYIDGRKKVGFPIYQAIRIVREISSFEHSQIREWLWTNKGQETFARAWLDGYTVEEEQRYVLKIGNLYLAEPLADMTSDIVRMTRDAEVAYRFTDEKSIATHLDKFEGTEAIKVEELEE